mmetsp:Transcript_52171/g.124325  ORF Transcript_52171/g.124325 Transcript_52171/m.124325 type:complete len:738 (+) Transcript_52171:134-2347(+)|eukprot:CAMPEP_0178438530 /NCGR_PEP_ID=MMETSP0689_2-20121128/35642_1 /TAXON_ID=160604 /ORGANISM="Amphidinium massartii, Strain CS-259" /LENGTH=737 /DNA_ID=CAMNT_0020060939 /DNA_START=91 /DNA_END=2304 /DNA_ORIENTATION=+
MAHQNIDLDLLFHKDSKDCKVSHEIHDKDAKVVNCLRCLAMDAVQKANSGHPGTPMAMAPVAYALWARVLNYDPEDPAWPNRDRFILSMGHACTLLYGLLHVAGVKDLDEKGKVVPDKFAMPMEALQQFRQYDSRAPGHPEYGWTAGVEATTGPLGQGVANSVGIAAASRWLAANFNKPDFELFSYDVYALASDGDLMEGVSAEAASLAGHWRLDNLCWIWDNNQITIDGNTAWVISEDLGTRFISYGWNVLRVGDANDVDALTRAIMVFKREKQRPTLIIVDSHIAWGAPTKQDTFSAHGAPLGEAEITETKRIYGWPNEKFLVPDEVRKHLQDQLSSRGGVNNKAWKELFAKYSQKYPQEAANLQRLMSKENPENWDQFCKTKTYPADPKGLATRQSSAECLNLLAKGIPWMLGGAADLAGSCLTALKFDGAGDFMPPESRWGDYGGRNLRFGIREHCMGSVCNGMALCGLRPFCATFLVFSDYMKPPIRLSAIMEIPSIWVFTHDSIGLGEDGPTHQPIEHLAALRSIPGLLTFRPCDANEVIETWKFIGKLTHEPAAVVLTRQAVPTLDRTQYAPASGVARGGYILADCEGQPQLILMATGSEVTLMLESYHALKADGVRVRAVSMPCLELFKNQPAEYVSKVLPDSCRARISIEAAVRDTWGCFIGLDGEHIGMITFGSSAPHKRLQQELGFTVDAVKAAAQRVMSKNPRSMESEADVMRAWKRRKPSVEAF